MSRAIPFICVLSILALLIGCSPADTTPLATATSADVTSTPTQPILTPTSTPSASPQPATAMNEFVATLSAGQWTYLFYHAGLGRVILVNGGPERGKPADDPLELWSWDGRQWSLISADTNGPTWRNFAAVTFDSDHGVLVVHGGLQNPSIKFDETWEWDGASWTQHAVPGPGLREGALMAYDAASQQTILFGGAVDLEIKGDTWAWDGSKWTLLTIDGPAARFPGGMVFDPVRREILITSGHFASTSGSFIDYGDLWAWNGELWSELAWRGASPGHRTHTGLVYDPQTENILLFGSGLGTFKSDVWAWDRTSWTLLPTTNMPDRSGHSVAYDEARNVFVLFGGVDRPGGTALSDTWEWNRTDWTCMEQCR